MGIKIGVEIKIGLEMKMGMEMRLNFRTGIGNWEWENNRGVQKT